jgi:hypothetical protein
MTVRIVFVALLLGACAAPRAGVRLDTGEGAPLEVQPTPSVRPISLEADAFEHSLRTLLLEVPLTLRTQGQTRWIRASKVESNADRSFGGFCEPRMRRGQCISLLDDVMGLSEWDRFGVALRLSLEPIKESIARSVEDTLAPQLLYSLIGTGFITWAALAANPEPAFTKAAALISTLLLVYLGVETFLDLLEASRELKSDTDQVTTWQDLESSGQRFASRVGPSIARVLVLAVTVAVTHGMTGGASLLAARLSTLPHFPDGALAGASRMSIQLARIEQVKAVSVAGGVVTISLPATAVAMVNKGSAPATASAAGARSWNSFSSLKRARGPAGQGKQWHHIVEQTDGNVQRFGPQALHNTENVIAVDEPIHQRISAYYSSKDARFTGAQTVRQWLSKQSFQVQRDFGLSTLARYGIVP